MQGVFPRVYFDALSDFRTMQSFCSTMTCLFPIWQATCWSWQNSREFKYTVKYTFYYFSWAYSLPISRDWCSRKTVRLSSRTGSLQVTSFPPNYSMYHLYKHPYQYKIQKSLFNNGGIVRVFILGPLLFITYAELQVIKPQALWYHAWILITSFITFFLMFLRGDKLAKCIFNLYLLQVKLPLKYWTFISMAGSEFKCTGYK